MSSLLDLIRNLLAQAANNGILPEIFTYAFVVNALIAAIIISPILGAVGIMVVSKRMAFFSESIGHAAMTGIALGILFGEPYTEPYISLFAFCILFGVWMNYTKNKTKVSSDTIIGVFLSMSLAVGSSLLIFVTVKVNPYILESVLFGSILTVSDKDIFILFTISILCIVLGIPFFNRMLLAGFNPSLALVRKIKVKLLDYAFVLIITLITVASVKIIGAILVEALLLIPASASRNLARSIKSFFCYSITFSIISCVLGVLIPIIFEIPIPSGSAIILVASSIFVVTTMIKILSKKFKA